MREAEREQLHADPGIGNEQSKRDGADARARTVEPGRKKLAREGLQLRFGCARRLWESRAWALQIDAEILWQIAPEPGDRGVSQKIQGFEVQPRGARGHRSRVGRGRGHLSPHLRR